jgi:ubiquitin C-terminal hydrolase
MGLDVGNDNILDIEDPNNHYGVNGITNLGNTCYVNATLHCLFKIQPLMDYFLSGLHLADTNTESTMGSQGKISYAFGDLMR